MNHTIPTCPECGAPAIDGLGCWEQLGLLIAWEFDDPDLQSEHFLTVAAYNLQHPAQYTDEALANLRAALIDYLERRVTVAELRKRAGKAYQGAKRVLRPAAERHPEGPRLLHRWSVTIADVYLPDQPAGAADRVRAWGVAIRRAL